MGAICSILTIIIVSLKPPDKERGPAQFAQPLIAFLAVLTHISFGTLALHAVMPFLCLAILPGLLPLYPGLLPLGLALFRHNPLSNLTAAKKQHQHNNSRYNPFHAFEKQISNCNLSVFL